jgi:hypothetical protein
MGAKGFVMKPRNREPAPAGTPETFSGRLWSWAQSLYDKAHDPSHCSRCGVYLPARDRICKACTREG